MTTPNLDNAAYAHVVELLRAHGIDPNAPLAPPPAEVVEPEPVHITAESGSRLEQLYDDLESLKPQLDKLETQIGEIKEAIKVELSNCVPEAKKVHLHRIGMPGAWVMRVGQRQQFNSKGFAKVNRDLYDAWCTWPTRRDLRRES